MRWSFIIAGLLLLMTTSCKKINEKIEDFAFDHTISRMVGVNGLSYEEKMAFLRKVLNDIDNDETGVKDEKKKLKLRYHCYLQMMNYSVLKDFQDKQQKCDTISFYCTQILETNPDETGLFLYNRAFYNYEAGNYHLTVIDLEKALHSTGTPEYARIVCAEAYVELGDYENARKIISESISSNDKKFVSFIDGKICLQQKDYTKAAESFSKTLEQAPDFYEVYILRGQVYEKIKGKEELARADYEKIIQTINNSKNELQIQATEGLERLNEKH